MVGRETCCLWSDRGRHGRRSKGEWPLSLCFPYLFLNLVLSCSWKIFTCCIISHFLPHLRLRAWAQDQGKPVERLQSKTVVKLIKETEVAWKLVRGVIFFVISEYTHPKLATLHCFELALWSLCTWQFIIEIIIIVMSWLLSLLEIYDRACRKMMISG